ncbi:hypothetical protein AKO1_009507 [Acrasis kona]|uniref:RGS domain-containing protein n=1 Tax=Acrasis kona TaxID=1008807 RepID=A0AAW2ZP34_9EUKA
MKYDLTFGSYGNFNWSTGSNKIRSLNLIDREALEKSRGLQRWEIGDIAAKIVFSNKLQSSYGYSLRTSDTRYLNESFVFYEAIRSRSYFKDTSSSAVLFNKKLRYFARFLVVLLFQNKREFAEVVIKELRELVNAYTNSFNLPDANEWQLVLIELDTFLKADVIVSVGPSPDLINYRTSLPDSNSLNLDATKNSPRSSFITIAESILVSNRRRHVKFSELSLDMFRIMQSLERTSDRTAGSRFKNAHKTMLHRPTFSEILFALSSCLQETDFQQCLLLYITVDDMFVRKARGNGAPVSPSTPTASDISLPLSLLTDQRSDINSWSWDDIVPFTRKPFFLIIETESSSTFIPRKNKFGQPLVCLSSSSISLPLNLQNQSRTGSLFTFFLTAPMLALAFMCGASTLDHDAYSKAVDTTNVALNELAVCLMSDSKIDVSYRTFLENVILRAYITRFILFHAVINRYFKNYTQKPYPTCFPEMHFLENPDSQPMVIVRELLENVLTMLNLTGRLASHHDNVNNT